MLNHTSRAKEIKEEFSAHEVIKILSYNSFDNESDDLSDAYLLVQDGISTNK